MPITILILSLAALLSATAAQQGQSTPDLLRKQGVQEATSGNFAAAEKDLTAALTQAQTANDFQQQFLCLEDLSRLSERQHDLVKAEDWLKRLLPAVKASNKISPTLALMDLDSFYRRHQMREQEISNLKEIIRFWSENAGSTSLGMAHYEAELGMVLNHQGEYTMAEEPLRNSLAILEKSGALYQLAADGTRRSLIQSLSAEGKVEEAGKLKASLMPDPAARVKPDVMPRVTIHKEPSYSEAAKKLRVSGTVRLALDVDETGHPQNVQVMAPLGEGLDENAIQAVSTWVFEPATKAGVPVSTHATVEVSFRLL